MMLDLHQKMIILYYLENFYALITILHRIFVCLIDERISTPFEENMQWELQFEGDIQSTKLVYHVDVVEPDEDDD